MRLETQKLHYVGNKGNKFLENDEGKEYDDATNGGYSYLQYAQSASLELQLDVRDALDMLTERERDILVRNVVHGETLQEICKDYDLSEGRMSQITKVAKKKLQGRLQEYENSS